MTARERLAELLAPSVVEALEELVAERVAEAVAAVAPVGNGESAWLTFAQAAERLGCSADAVRMRASRGRLRTRTMGRRVYVSRADVDGLG